MAERFLIALMLSVFVIVPSHAERMFKIVDENGNVTYQAAPPSDVEGSIEQREIMGGEDPAEETIARERAVLNYPVTLYAIKKCKPCDTARKQLQDRDVPFKERDPTSGDKVYKEFTEMINGTTVPAISVGDKLVTEYTQENLKKVLDSAGYPSLEKKKDDEQADEL